jgi:hypothetical protein
MCESSRAGRIATGRLSTCRRPYARQPWPPIGATAPGLSRPMGMRITASAASPEAIVICAIIRALRMTSQLIDWIVYFANSGLRRL